ncbi:MAG: substrate-binding domain-containing protein [Armatimonas sp.]
MRRLVFPALALLLCLSLGCPKPRFRSGTAQDPIRYVFISRSDQDMPALLAIRAAETMAGEAATGANKMYRIERVAPVPPTADAQAAEVEKLIPSDPDGIVVMVNASPKLDAAIKKATDKDIPVICIGADAPKSGRTAVCAPSDLAIGEELARQFLDASKVRYGKVAILSTDPKSDSMQARLRGADRHLRSSAPDLILLKPLYCEGDSKKAAALIRKAVAETPDLKGLLLLGEWALTDDQARKSLPDPAKVTTVAADISTGARELLRTGKIARLVAPRCVEMGREAIKALEALRQEKKDEFGAPIDTGYDVIYKDFAVRPVGEERGGIRAFSVGEYDDRWQRWMDKGSDDL